MPARWLFKTEPSEFSYGELEKRKRSVWDGVANATALLHLAKVRRGDRLLIYHTGSEKAVVGEARVVRGAYPDPGAGDPRRVVVDVAPQARWAVPVPLERIKKDPRFKRFDLVRISRLSVMPVPDDLWEALRELGRS